MAAVVHVKSTPEFDKIVAENEIVVIGVLFGLNNRCGPCKMISPRFEQFSTQYSKAKFVKVDVDEVPDVAQKCGIRAMPTFQIFVKGSKAKEIVGADPRKLEDAIKQFAA